MRVRATQLVASVLARIGRVPRVGWWMLAGSTGLLATIGLLIWSAHWLRHVRDLPQSFTPPSARILVTDLLLQYDTNPAIADRNYNAQWIEVLGASPVGVEAGVDPKSGDPFLDFFLLGDPWKGGLSRVHCTFSNKWKAAIRNRTRWYPVRGVCTGVSGDLVCLEDCELVMKTDALESYDRLRSQVEETNRRCEEGEEVIRRVAQQKAKDARHAAQEQWRREHPNANTSEWSASSKEQMENERKASSELLMARKLVRTAPGLPDNPHSNAERARLEADAMERLREITERYPLTYGAATARLLVERMNP